MYLSMCRGIRQGIHTANRGFPSVKFHQSTIDKSKTQLRYLSGICTHQLSPSSNHDLSTQRRGVIPLHKQQPRPICAAAAGLDTVPTPSIADLLHPSVKFLLDRRNAKLGYGVLSGACSHQLSPSTPDLTTYWGHRHPSTSTKAHLINGQQNSGTVPIGYRLCTHQLSPSTPELPYHRNDEASYHQTSGDQDKSTALEKETDISRPRFSEK